MREKPLSRANLPHMQHVAVVTPTKFGTFAKASKLTLTIAVLAGVGLLPLTGSRFAVAQAQELRESTMQLREEQVIRGLTQAGSCDAKKTAVQLALQTATANMPVLVSKDARELTEKADQMITESEMRMAAALLKFGLEQDKCPEAQGLAFDVKHLIEEGSEVRRALRPFTEKCGQGDSILKEKCDQLQPHLDEETGREVYGPPPPPRVIIGPGFSVKLRGPFVPPYSRQMQEDVRVTAPIAPGQCAVVFKETKGLMLRLIFVRMDIVLDPWATSTLTRGTRIPVWALQWVPAEYVKEWNICNVAGKIQKTITQRVIQDVPSNYFWRYYPKDP